MTRSQMRLRAKRGKREQLLRDLDRLEALDAVRESPGFLGAVVLVPEGDPDGVLLEQSWASVEHYERWRATDGSDQMLRGLRRMLADEPDEVVYQIVDTLG